MSDSLRILQTHVFPYSSKKRISEVRKLTELTSVSLKKPQYLTHCYSVEGYQCESTGTLKVLILLNLLLDWRLGSIFSHTELLFYGILYPMMLNMQKIPYSLNNCMIRIIENGVVADLRKTEATSDL